MRLCKNVFACVCVCVCGHVGIHVTVQEMDHGRDGAK